MKIHCLYDKLLKIEELKPHPKNPNTHSEEQIERLAKILNYQGFRYAIKVSNQSGFITSGHGRLEAARKNGWESVPVVYQDYENDDQEYADIVADNSIASWAELDFSKINLEIPEFDPSFDIELLGLKDFHIEVADKAQCDEDETPELPKESKVKRGDVFILGNHRLMCGDSTMIGDVEKLMNGEKADMVFTDPPYGVSYTKKTKEIFNSNEYTEIKNDEKQGEDLKSFFRDLFTNLFTVLHEKSSYYICSPQGGDSELMMMMMRESGLKCRHQIIWVKNTPVFSMGRLDYDYKHEPILYGWVKSHDFKRKGSQDKSVWEFKRTENKLHPTMKPVELIENAILNSTDQSQSIIDICGGSGSTLIACEKTNRKCFMMELDEHYCSVILDRWEKYSGKKANHEDGRSWEEIKNG